MNYLALSLVFHHIIKVLQQIIKNEIIMYNVFTCLLERLYNMSHLQSQLY